MFSDRIPISGLSHLTCGVFRKDNAEPLNKTPRGSSPERGVNEEVNEVL
jgi:hypothetical protein